MEPFHMKKNAAFFDLFFTLTSPSYSLERNENDVLGLTIQEWETFAESQSLYCERAVGKIKDGYTIIERIVEKSGLHASPAQIREILQLREARMKSALTNIESEVLHTLSSLKEKGIRLCLISNADVIDKAWWDNSPLFPLFDDAVFSCDVGFLKPQREIYEIALKRMDTNAQSSFFVGDGGSGEIKAAKAIGMFTVLSDHFLKRKNDQLDTLLQHTDFHAKTFSDILRLFS